MTFFTDVKKALPDIPNEHEDVLVAETQVDLHGLVVLALVGEEGGEGPQQGAVVRLQSEGARS